jgi:hypothetical protein
MAWKKGPLPENTWGWGGVVPVGEEAAVGFYFADFRGSCVALVGTDAYAHGGPGGPPKILHADQVAFYDNSLELPPGVKGRAGA